MFIEVQPHDHEFGYNRTKLCFRSHSIYASCRFQSDIEKWVEIETLIRVGPLSPNPTISRDRQLHYVYVKTGRPRLVVRLWYGTKTVQLTIYLGVNSHLRPRVLAPETM
jgi:hypothetical protein